MPDSKVVSIDGNEVKHAEPNPDVIQTLEKALAEARSGEIQQIVVVKAFHDECIGHVCVGRVVHKWAMYGALSDAAATYRDAFLKESE